MTLPPRAAAKFMALEDAEREAQALVNATTARLGELHKAQRLDPHSDRSASREAELARLQSRHAGQQARFLARAALNGRLRQWLNRAGAASGALEDVRTVKRRPKAGENAIDVVAAVRKDIAALSAERVSLRNCGLPKADMKRIAAAYVADRAAAAQPRIRADHDGFAFAFASDDRFGPINVIDAMAWFDADALLKKLHKEIDAMPDRLALSPKDRAEKLAEITSALSDLERKEEALIEFAEEQDQFIARRADADPLAILNIAYAEKQKATA